MIASQVPGYAGVDDRGPSGLELGLDRPLAGRAGSETIVKDPLGHAIDTISSSAARDGQDVYLTLDHTIQSDAETGLRATVARWHAKSGSAVGLEPKTGAILAMAVAPRPHPLYIPAPPPAGPGGT